MNPITKRRLRLAFFLLIPLVLFAVIRERQSWRPRVLGKGKNWVTALAWTTDGKYLASADGVNYVNGPRRGEIRLWNVRDGSFRIVQPDGKDIFQRLQFLPGNQKIAAQGYYSRFYTYDLNTGKSSPTPQWLKHWNWALSPDGKSIAFPQMNSDYFWYLVVRQLKSGKAVKIGSFSSIRDVAFSSDGKKIGAYVMQKSNKTAIYVWDLQTPQRPSKVLPVNWDLGNKVSFWPDDSCLTLAHELSGNDFQVFNLPHGKLEKKWTEDGDPTVLSPDGVMVAQVTPTTIDLRSYPSEALVRTLRTLDYPAANRIWTVSFSPNGRTLAAGDMEGNITLYRVK